MFGALKFWDLVWVFAIFSLFGGGSAAYASYKRNDGDQLRRI
jgi:hypothetical protein